MRFPRILLFAVLILLAFPASARCQGSGVGLGIIIGEPTGFSFKGWLDSRSAIDIGLAWSFVREGSFHIHADYLYHSFHVFETTENVPLYFGVGGRIKTGRDTDARVGVRGVIGIGYLFKDAPVDLFLEVAPIIDLTPSTDLQVNAGFGARFFFR
ncbi:MAG TPA: hypothetical protein VGR15_06160 [Bacteroidota bacterium]|jgi:hypothetical protein|nr:hypothetical protein [Bacteroidota bacterium]